jgi:hypothetical protein
MVSQTAFQLGITLMLGTVQTIGQDTHGHLLGIHAFVNAGDGYMIPGSLGAACFWVGLRQEIYSAVINHQMVRMNLDHTIVDRGIEPADDDTWANRAVVHCADVLNYCFGDLGPTAKRWRELEGWNREWAESVPSTYSPIFFRDRPKDGSFPEIWYHRSCQGTAPNIEPPKLRRALYF